MTLELLCSALKKIKVTIGRNKNLTVQFKTESTIFESIRMLAGRNLRPCGTCCPGPSFIKMFLDLYLNLVLS